MERELTAPVSLTNERGLLNRAAVGWARTPLVNTDGIAAPRFARPPKAWGRNKRWEYWNVITPTHIVALTVSNIDYAALNEIWVFHRPTHTATGGVALHIPATGVTLPGTLGHGEVRAGGKGVDIAIDEVLGGTRLRGRFRHHKLPSASFDIHAAKPEHHEGLAVVVPWSDTRFQYTVKDVARPAHGWLHVGSETVEIPEGSWAVLDHGRGRWPYDITWNWGAGSGVWGGRTIGIQVGGKWTDGTGSTENSLTLDGRLHKISAELTWDYDLNDLMAPWQIRGGGLEATFTPFYNKQSRTNFGVLLGHTDQCFGRWEGTFTIADGEDPVRFQGIEGFAEHVHNRW